jgi:hypothetical protein
LAENEVVCPSCGYRVSVSVGETEKECPNCGTPIHVRTTLEDAEIAEAGGEEQVAAQYRAGPVRRRAACAPLDGAVDRERASGPVAVHGRAHTLVRISRYSKRERL